LQHPDQKDVKRSERSLRSDVNVKADTFCSTPVSKATVNFPPSIIGRANINFEMYSGYVNITNAPDYLFYWFFSSQDGNPNAPLIIWTNGS
jgi:carboxypeptidase C (cathepsin A)